MRDPCDRPWGEPQDPTPICTYTTIQFRCLEKAGAYAILCLCAWNDRDGTVPDDDVLLARKCGVSRLRWTRHIAPDVLEHFEKTASGGLRPTSRCWKAAWTRRIRGTLTRETKLSVFERDGYRCRHCGGQFAIDQLECDHLEPVSAGGSNRDNNLATSCLTCNRIKGPTPLKEWMAQ